MSQEQDEYAASKAIYNAAQDAVKQTEAVLREGEEFFRSMGLDRSKVVGFSSKLSAADQRKAEELVKKDVEDAEIEAKHAKSQGGLPGSDPSGGNKAKRPRSMV